MSEVREYFERGALERDLNARLAALRKRNGDFDHYTQGFDEAVDRVENFPAVDAVAVTRCKDCEHYDMGVCLKIYSDGNVHSASWQERKPDDFCSYGELRRGNSQ